MESINSELHTSHIEVEDLNQHVNQEIYIHGVIYKIRQMSGFAFVILRTKRHLVQCLYSFDNAHFSLDKIRINMSVVFKGLVMVDERSRSGLEIVLISCEILSEPAEDPSIVINNKTVATSLETLLDFRPLTLRNARERAIFKIQEGICRGFRDYLYRNRFVEIHTPKIVFNGAEGGANIFKLDYFGKEAFLAQSPQFYKQIMVGVYERVFEIAPVFRAEKHDTSRHINEYTSVDLEIGFINDFYDIMHVETQMVKETLAFLQENYQHELALLNADMPVLTDIPVITFAEAKNLLSRLNKNVDDDDLAPEEEKLICENLKKQTSCDFVFVTHYKSSKRPFYTMESKENPQLTNSFDLLFRGMEVTTGGQRIHSHDAQIAKMQRLGMDISQFESYLMAHKYGLPPHGGLGLGLERFTSQLLGFPNIRYATMFPRDINRLVP
jgi:nondiscriminating aspartyl-tRNA synthetase